MNRTRGFVNLNRFKSGRAIKQLQSAVDKTHKTQVGKRKTKSALGGKRK